jgi:hypothetical protein
MLNKTCDRFYGFYNILGKRIGVFCTEYCYFLLNLDLNIGFKKSAIFFAEKAAKIDENCDHNIDSRNITLNNNIILKAQ